MKTKGLIIKKKDIGEADRYITVFTEKLGKIDFLVKGIRKSKKREINSSEVLTISNFSLYKKGDKYILSSIDLIQDYYDLKIEIDKLQQGYYIILVIDKIVYPNDIKREFFQRVERALNYIVKNCTEKNYILILKMLKWIVEEEGYKIEIKGKKYLDLLTSEITNTNNENSISISERVFNIIEWLEGKNNIKVEKEEKDILDTISFYERYLNYHLDTNIRLKSCLFGGEI